MHTPSSATVAGGSRSDTAISRQSLPALGSFVGARNYLEQRLAVMWQRILEVEPIGAEDRWADLGGDAVGAAALFAEIETHLGRKLPLSVLSEADTVAKLAALIDPQPALRAQPAMIFQAAGRLPPVHCVHGLHGTALFASLLANHVGPEQPVVGFQARGFTGDAAPHDSIAAIAADYIEILRLWRGPYRLIGWCVGSMIAFEMAQRLRAEGEDVARLILIDPPVLPLRVSSISPGEEAIARLRDRQAGSPAARAYQEAVIKIVAGIEHAARGYRLRPYAGSLAILSSEENHAGLTHEASAWRAAAKGPMMVRKIAPTHMSIVGAYAPNLGVQVRRLLDSP
jgi:thioesterase domain-containing protein/acyl carrier protein